MKDRIKLQLAIQGGGAKIVAILATLEAIEELESDIQITRIVGTSAGAIAGVFFASDVGIKDLVKDWKSGVLNDLLKTLTIPKPFLGSKEAGFVKSLLTPRPLWPSDNIHKYLAKAIQKDGHQVTSFDDLEKRKGVKVTVISTNLRNRASEESKGSDPIVATLIDSAGIPFMLRKWGNGGSPVIVDGGIGENLPAARLDFKSSEETPVSISFKPRDEANSNPDGFFSFSLALLDAAIDVSSKKSGALVPHTHFIDTTIDTFGFDKALNSLTTGEYADIKKRAKDWFSDLVASIRLRREQKAISDFVTLRHPWQTENPIAQAIMKDLWTAINGQFGKQSFRFHEVELRATLDSLGAVTGPDRVTNKVEFEPGDETLYCYWFGVSDGVESQLTEEPTLSIVCVETREYVPHVQVPIISNDGGGPGRFIAIFFTPGLVKGKRYLLTHTEVGKNLLNRLPKEKKDDLGIDPSRVIGAIGRVKLVVDVPNSVKNYSIKQKRGLKAKEICEYEHAELLTRKDVPLSGNYSTYLVEGRDVEGLFAIDLTIGS